MKTRFLLIGAAMAALALMQPLAAATATSNVTVSATVAASAKLTLGSATVTFPDADPETVPSINASEGAVSITAKARTSAAGSVTLTLLAANDLKSGSDTIGISNVTWTATGTGFAGGTMNKTTAQSVGTWTGSGTQTGTVSFKLANSWNYATGAYSVSATYTLTAP
jgi:hypothetical protein